MSISLQIRRLRSTKIHPSACFQQLTLLKSLKDPVSFPAAPSDARSLCGRRSLSAALLRAVLPRFSLLTSSCGGVSPCHPDPIQSLCLMNSWNFINKRYLSVIKAILQCWMSCKEKQNRMLSSKRCLATDYKKSLHSSKEHLKAQKWDLADWDSCPCFVMDNLYDFAEHAKGLIL